MKQSPNTIVFVPAGGLCNRMKAIASAVCLARSCGARLQIKWFQDWGLGCKFADLFEPLPFADVRLDEVSTLDKLLYDRPRAKNLRLPALFQRLMFPVRMDEKATTAGLYAHLDFPKVVKGHDAWLAANVYFMSQDIPQDAFDAFRPVAALRQKIRSRAAGWDERVIGVHIRRTDNRISIAESPTQLFVERMRREPADTRFFLATDSEDVKKELLSCFGERVIFSPDKAERGTRKGMEEALVELYLLSRCRLILGSSHSTYSLTAASIGHKTIEIMRRQ